jgi:hypothetical protein
VPQLAIFQGAHRSENCIRLSIILTFTIILQNYAGNKLTQNHESANVSNIGQGETRRRKRKRLKLGGGQAYDRLCV